MKSASVFLVSILAFSISALSYSAGLICVGKYGSGQLLHVIFDVDSATININGKILEIENGSKDMKEIWTKNFLSDLGVLSKIVLILESPKDDNPILNQINSVTHELISKASLSCKRYD